jgi:hypothetical protein
MPALGIGARSSASSTHFYCAPCHIVGAERLVRIALLSGEEEGQLSMLELRDLREQTSIFKSVAPYIPGAQYNYSGDGPPEELAAVWCQANCSIRWECTAGRGLKLRFGARGDSGEVRMYWAARSQNTPDYCRTGFTSCSKILRQSLFEFQVLLHTHRVNLQKECGS